MSRKRTILNISLAVLAIFLMGTAAYFTWLPPHTYAYTEGEAEPEKGDVADSTPDIITNPLPETTMSETNVSEFPETTDAADKTAATSVSKRVKSTHLREANIESMIRNHPYRNEAVKVLSGRLPVTDSLRRRNILTYCEHFRRAYDTKDIDFLSQVFSDNALIIVGHTVRTGRKEGIAGNEKVQYSIRSKQEYLERLSKIFNSNQKIKVRFSDFHIMRHPTVDGIYGVSLRQKYSSGTYADEGYLFLLWDFRNESRPKIHVRTWQTGKSLEEGEEPIEMSDFNLE